MNTTQPTEETWNAALNTVSETLAKQGWNVRRTGSGILARRGWLSVSLKHHDDRPDAPWRARLRDCFPRFTVAAQRSTDAFEALEPVLRAAHAHASFIDSESLVSNPSKGWLAHRVWQACQIPQS